MKTAAAQRQNRGFCSGANVRCKIRSRPRAETGLSAYFWRGGWQMSPFFAEMRMVWGGQIFPMLRAAWALKWFRVLYIIFQKAIFQQPHDLSPK